MENQPTLRVAVAAVLLAISWNAMADDRCSSDGYGNTTCRDSNGNTTRCSNDGYGNTTCR